MKTRMRSIIFIAAILVIVGGCSKQVSFKGDVNPILASNCLVCHNGGGEGIKKSGFSVKSYNSLMKGTKYASVVVPGDSISSTLYRMVDHKVDRKIHMPPHHVEALAKGRLEPLTSEQIGTIRMWIDQGAKNN